MGDLEDENHHLIIFKKNQRKRAKNSTVTPPKKRKKKKRFDLDIFFTAIQETYCLLLLNRTMKPIYTVTN